MQHTCGFFSPLQIHIFLQSAKKSCLTVSLLTLCYLCILIYPYPMLKLLCIICIHRETCVCVHVCADMCTWAYMCINLPWVAGWRGSGQLRYFICWVCIHRAFCTFVYLLGLLTFFIFLLSCHFLCEDFSDLLKTLHHIISCTRTSFHLF